MIVRRAEELSVDEVLARREMVVAVADGEITAAALLADFLVAGADGHLDFSMGAPALERASLPRAAAPILGALVWRIGANALRFYATGAGDLLAWGIVDALVPRGEDSVEWTRGWLAGPFGYAQGRRSTLALDAAAALIRFRGGHELERAEFARLFAIGEPQIGMAAFLARRRLNDER